MISKGELKEVIFDKQQITSFDHYPVNLPFLKTTDRLAFHPEVTFFIGENGTGKSSLIEAIAVLSGFNPEGGSANFNFNTRASHSELHRYLRTSRGVNTRKDGYFLRSESFFNVATNIEQLDEDNNNDPPIIKGRSKIIDSYGGKSLHEQSHGESFWALFLNRFSGNGFYILDEPEAALSPTRQMAMLLRINELVKLNSQFIIATHSPILIAYPNCIIYEFTSEGIEVKKYAETGLFCVYKDFFTNTEQLIEFLLTGKE